MNRLQHGIIAAFCLFGELIGFTAGLAITALLLILTTRASRLPGTPVANLALAICGIFWNAGGLTHACLLVAGAAPISRPALAAIAIQFSAAAAWPIPLLAIWRQFASGPRRRRFSWVLLLCAIASALMLVALLWLSLIVSSGRAWIPDVKELAGYNAAVVLILGTALLLKEESTPRLVRMSSLTILSAVVVAISAVTIAKTIKPGPEITAALLAGSEQLVLLVVLGAFFLFTRFRFADVFLRQSVRVLLAAIWALALIIVTQSPALLRVTDVAAHRSVARMAASVVIAAILFFVFLYADARLGAQITTRCFRILDHREASRRLSERLSCLQSQPEIAAAVEVGVIQTLGASGARLIPLDAIPTSRCPAALSDGEIVELRDSDHLRQHFPLPRPDFLVPVSSAGRVSHVLVLSSGSGTGLLSHELNYLHSVASQCGNRLDALAREYEMAELQSRESLLLQQITEAELRALRAQINPHFLFNSLTTLADLIARDPRSAEAMTLRLARVFRYVLAHSSRHVTPVQEEIEFLRTYLYIEEARFGDRLRVQIDVAPEVFSESIPSLILQPLVENALKHGLGPKPGPGHLSISAFAQQDRLYLIVEDDGVGAKTTTPAPSRTGLTNVAERLSTLYRGRAGLNFESPSSGGSRVTIFIPRGVVAA